MSDVEDLVGRFTAWMTDLGRGRVVDDSGAEVGEDTVREWVREWVDDAGIEP